MSVTTESTFDGNRAIPSGRVNEMMLKLLDLKPSDKVLEIGTGSGFQTIALGATGAEIHSIELQPWLDAVDLDGKTNIYLHSGDGRIGLEAEAPFSAIVATCGVPEIPREWKEQLGDKGKLVVPLGDQNVQKLTLFVKDRDELHPVLVAAYVRFQMMREKPKPKPPKYAVDSQAN